MSHSNATRFLREFYRFYWHARMFGKPVRESLAYAREPRWRPERFER